MNRILVFLWAILLLFSGCAAPATEGIEVRDAWMRPADEGGNGAVYFVIRSSEADELIGVSSDLAEAGEMHESMMSGDVMEMHPLEAVPLGAGEQVEFEPGGLHIMLVDLERELEVGDEIEVTLQFRNFEEIKVNVPVTEGPVQ